MNNLLASTDFCRARGFRPNLKWENTFDHMINSNGDFVRVIIMPDDGLVKIIVFRPNGVERYRVELSFAVPFEIFTATINAAILAK